jgi:hypothetical protein
MRKDANRRRCVYASHPICSSTQANDAHDMAWQNTCLARTIVNSSFKFGSSQQARSGLRQDEPDARTGDTRWMVRDANARLSPRQREDNTASHVIHRHTAAISQNDDADLSFR